ncbi:GPP34 family phosphoprotein [Solwaraspora sp. WMMA2059]|uniref:GOLPH3/VPS74 family protein n=2 Tax=unclassified Solwaraspora TaxID=2627926 RepID=UPI00248C1A95|nr:GPP34 family phosphoprotein [Solwaraspora sp. WMMA2059]WBB96618.1 GPP34 family phosphoprotein [Solwaraspora sp. WMMA2059]
MTTKGATMVHHTGARAGTGTAAWADAAMTLPLPAVHLRRPLLADEFFLLAQDAVTGRLRLPDRAVGFGLAAALLVDLVDAGALRVRDGRLWLAARHVPVDALGGWILRWMAAEPGYRRVGTWLALLAPGAHQQVARRLVAAGVVRRRTVRRLLATAVRHVPVDPNRAGWAWARLTVRLQRGEPLPDLEARLAGLCLVTGLDDALLTGLPAAARRHLHRETSGRLPTEVGELFTIARNRLDGASHRRRSGRWRRGPAG